MATPRNPKRARKKERKHARREEWRRVVRKRRRQRWGVVLGSLAVIAVGALIAFVAFRPDDDATPLASPDATASAAAGEVACGADVPAAANQKKPEFGEPEDEKLNPERVYTWTLQTSCGPIVIDLDLERAPKTVNSVTFLTREGFYDGLTFHRIAEAPAVIQGGDPLGDGNGGPGYDVVEPPPDDLKYEKGIVAMAKTGTDPPGTSGSQFFIMYDAYPLDPDYALLGEVVDRKSLEVVDKIAELATPSEAPEQPVYIEKATVAIKVGARAGE
jgi:cyclophilin family peptidyl-prolyl cis-trans isomerase